MILADLCALYDSLEGTDDALPPLCFSAKRPDAALVIAPDGTPREIRSLVPQGAKVGVRMVVPAGQRSSGISPYFLCDNLEYLVGDGAKKAGEKRERSKELHHEVLDGVDGTVSRAVLGFFDGHATVGELEAVARDFMDDPDRTKKTLVFMVEGEREYAHEDASVAEAWTRYRQEKEERENGLVDCMVTGKAAARRARLFPKITGVPGAQSAGASLVGANADSFLSYGQEKNDVAGISAEAAHKASEALSYLIKDRGHSVKLGKEVVVFWTDSPEPEPNDFMQAALGSSLDETGNSVVRVGEDQALADAVAQFLLDLRSGRRPGRIPQDAGFHILGLSPYQARLSVRFYEAGSMGGLMDHVERFLVEGELQGARPLTVAQCLRQCAPQGNLDNLPRPLVTSVFDAFLSGTAFPPALYVQVLSRMRADGGFVPARMGKADVIDYRASVLKLCLARARGDAPYPSEKGKELTVALNPENHDPAYLLGRLFALFEKAQLDANGGKKPSASIRDRYMGAAATTPARVYPQLINLYGHHQSKASSGSYIDRTVGEVVDELDGGFPATLDLEEQGVFYIGYYQQRQDLYRSKKGSDDNRDEAAEGK